MSGKSRHLMIAQLLADGSLNDSERAEIVGCSTRTIGRVRQELREEVASDDSVLDRFQRHLEARIPVERCVEELVKLIEQDAHLPSKLAAIKRYQELLGVVTDKEARKRPQEEQEHKPMMVFPPGCNPIINVNLKPGEPVKLGDHRPDQKSGASGAIKVAAVRVEEKE